MKITKMKPIFELAKETEDVILMSGLHGIGKSEVVKSYCKDNDYFVQVLMLSLMDTGDILGIPHIENNQTKWAEPDFIQNLKNAVMPNEIDIDNLVFEDKDFEEFVRDIIRE